MSRAATSSASNIVNETVIYVSVRVVCVASIDLQFNKKNKRSCY